MGEAWRDKVKDMCYNVDEPTILEDNIFFPTNELVKNSLRTLLPGIIEIIDVAMETGCFGPLLREDVIVIIYRACMDHDSVFQKYMTYPALNIYSFSGQLRICLLYTSDAADE